MIGVEFAEIFAALGVEVTIVEMLNSLLPLMDADLGKALGLTFGRRNVRLFLESRVARIGTEDGALQATVETPHGEETLGASKILVAVGRRPNVEDLGLEAAGVRVEKAGILVNAQMQTNVPGIYAIGGATGGTQLAHVASQGGEVAVENALGHSSKLNLKTVPSCVCTDPEIASVGLTETQAREAGHDVRLGRFPLTASGKAQTYGVKDGFVQVVSEARFGELLGLHIVAPHASDLIHEGALALALEATLDELATTVHGHPTLGEAIRDAALAARGAAIHLPL